MSLIGVVGSEVRANMSVTRFKDARAGYDGPVIGSLQILTAQFDTVAGTTTPRVDIDLPAGMRFRVTDATFRAQSVTSTPEITIGTIAASSSLVATVAAATLLGPLTLKAAGQHYASGDVIRVTITAGSGDALTKGVVTLVGHVSDAPASVDVRSGSHY